MPEEQLSALLAKLKVDAELREKLKGAADLDAALAIAREAGFDVRKADWLRIQANQILELTNAELESMAGGNKFQNTGNTCIIPDTPVLSANGCCYYF